MKKHLIIILLSGAALFIGCSGSINLVSSPSEGKVIVDGNASEWNNLTPIKNENIAVGFKNDKDYLYIALVTNERNKIMKIFTGGLEVWLQPKDSDSKIGVKYPDKPDPADVEEFHALRRQREESGDTTGDTNTLPPFFSTQKELSIINNDGKVLKNYPIDGNTYQAKISAKRENFCYELRIPIGDTVNSPNGVKTKPGEKVQVEFLTGSMSPDIRRVPENEGGPMGYPGGGGGRMGGGRREGGYGRPGGSRGSNPGPLDYQFEVTLK